MRKQMNELAYTSTQAYKTLKYVLFVYLCFINPAWNVQAKSNDSQVEEKSKAGLGPILEKDQ